MSNRQIWRQVLPSLYFTHSILNFSPPPSQPLFPKPVDLANEMAWIVITNENNRFWLLSNEIFLVIRKTHIQLEKSSSVQQTRWFNCGSRGSLQNKIFSFAGFKNWIGGQFLVQPADLALSSMSRPILILKNHGRHNKQ